MHPFIISTHLITKYTPLLSLYTPFHNKIFPSYPIDTPSTLFPQTHPPHFLPKTKPPNPENRPSSAPKPREPTILHTETQTTSQISKPTILRTQTQRTHHPPHQTQTTSQIRRSSKFALITLYFSWFFWFFCSRNLCSRIRKYEFELPDFIESGSILKFRIPDVRIYCLPPDLTMSGNLDCRMSGIH